MPGTQEQMNEEAVVPMSKKSICAEFPDTWEEFVEKWAYDVEVQDEDNYDFQVKRVVDVYRVKQMMWYYLGREAGTNPKDFGNEDAANA